MKTKMIQYKYKNLPGQRQGVRSHAYIDCIHEELDDAVGLYRANRAAKLWLDGHGSWEGSLHELEDDDVRLYVDPSRLKKPGRQVGTNNDTIDGQAVVECRPSKKPMERTQRDRTGETRKALSWIWTTAKALNINDNTDKDDKILRLEWCKSCARALRAMEEVAKVREEMRPTLEYLLWKARWWRERASSRSRMDSSMLEGLSSYAACQAAVYTRLHDSFKALWETPLSEELEEPKRDEEEGAER